MADDGEQSTDKHGQSRRTRDITVTSSRDKQLDPRWFLYPAYILVFLAGGLVIKFTMRSQEWSAIPVAMAWGLLFLWYWLYGVAFRYRRPVLKYFSLAGALGFGGLLTAFCFDRAPPQLAATAEGVVVRGLLMDLIWAGVTTATSAVIIGLHAILFSRARGS